LKNYLFLACTPKKMMRSYRMGRAELGERYHDEEKMGPNDPLVTNSMSGILRSGYLRKRSRFLRTWKRGYFRLYNERMCYYGDINDDVPRREVALQQLDRVLIDGSTHLRLIWKNGNGSFQLRADTMAEALDWARALTTAISSQRQAFSPESNFTLTNHEEKTTRRTKNIPEMTTPPTRLPAPRSSVSMPSTPLDYKFEEDEDDHFFERAASIAAASEAVDELDTPPRWIIAPQKIEINHDPFQDENDFIDDGIDESLSKNSSIQSPRILKFSSLSRLPQDSSRSAMGRRYEQLGILPTDNEHLLPDPDAAISDDDDDDQKETYGTSDVEYENLSFVQRLLMNIILCNGGSMDCTCPMVMD